MRHRRLYYLKFYEANYYIVRLFLLKQCYCLLFLCSKIKQAVMTWNDFVYGLGDLLTETFTILPILGNIPNILFTLVIMAGLVYWIFELKKYKAEARRNGTIE